MTKVSINLKIKVNVINAWRLLSVMTKSCKFVLDPGSWSYPVHGLAFVRSSLNANATCACRSSDEESVSERGRPGANSTSSGLSMRLMPLNIPSLMTSPQSKVAPLSLGGLLVAAPQDNSKE